MFYWAEERGYIRNHNTVAIALLYENKGLLLQLLRELCPYDRVRLYQIADQSQKPEKLRRWLDKYLP
jgi:hypothetical protein